VIFETRSGRLTVSRRGKLLIMDFPAIPPAAAQPPEGLLAILGGSPEAFFNIRSVHGANYHMAVFSQASAIAALHPDTAAMARDFNANVIATAPGTDGADFVSRFFAPASGVPEDPVTGSAHCTLAPYWAARLGKTRLLGRQISRRGGEVGCEVVADRVRLSGQCVRYLEGRIHVAPLATR
jgi:predicted PhzF superfamily epimerase YddE/YHI9